MQKSFDNNASRDGLNRVNCPSPPDFSVKSHLSTPSKAIRIMVADANAMVCELQAAAAVCRVRLCNEP